VTNQGNVVPYSDLLASIRTLAEHPDSQGIDVGEHVENRLRRRVEKRLPSMRGQPYRQM
jgi:hypothetical protein